MKAVEQDIQFKGPNDSSLILKDISLSQKGPNEDSAFAGNPDMHFNIRRGLSVLEYINEKNKKVEKSITARKGLHKFFDINFEFLDLSECPNLPKNIKKTHVSTNKMTCQLHNIILDPVRKAFEEDGNHVLIYKSEKANGENAQVSYVAELDSWVLCSKNVSTMARTEQDLENLSGSRYDFAILIGQAWFHILKGISEEKIVELKHYMNGKTFVAEYCGNQKYQHLVKYNQIDLFFYAIVENESEVDCLPLETSTEIFKYFGLTQCKFEKFVATNWDEFNYTLYKLYERVSHSSIEEDGEGAVLYLFSKSHTNEITPLSLCKLKTLEYRLFRKLREKLKTFIAKRRDQQKIFKKYQVECEELCQFFAPSKPLEYYYSIAEVAFNFIANQNSQYDLNLISTKYISFLDLIKQSVEEKIEITKEYIKDQLAKMPLTTEEIEQLQNQDIKKGRVVILCPAFYLTKEIEDNLIEELQLEGNKAIERNWSSHNTVTSTQHVSIIHIAPYELKPEQVNKISSNTYFIICGFSEKGLEHCRKKLVSENIKYDCQDHKGGKNKNKKGKKPNTEQQGNDQCLPYVKASDLDNFFKLQTENCKKFAESISKFSEENVMWIDDLYEGKQQLEASTYLNEQVSLGYAFFQLRTCGLELKQLSSKKSEVKEKIQQELIIFIPLTIPSTGKSTLIQSLEQLKGDEYSLRVIASDKIREELMNIQRIKKQNMSHDEAFKKTGKQATAEWESRLKALIRDTTNTGKEKNIIFLDKNHPPNAIDKVTIFIRENVPKGIKYQIIGLLPECHNSLQLSKFQFPFSATYLLTCIHRGINRQSHETLVGDEGKITSIILMFFNFFRNTAFKNQYQISKYGLDQVLAVPFHKETEQSDSLLPKPVTTEMENALTKIRPGEDQQNLAHAIQFLASYYKYLDQFEFLEISKQEQCKIFEQKIKTCLEQLKEGKSQKESGNEEEEESKE